MNRPFRSFRAIALTVATLMGSAAAGLAFAQESGAAKHEVDIPPIGARPANQAVPKEALGPAVDPQKGYRIEQLGRGLYMVTDNAYQSMFMVYESGVVVIDAPPSYASRLKQAIAEVTRLPVTHLIYSHAHTDHIGGAAALGGHPIIVAHEETRRLLQRAADPARPIPTVVFGKTHLLQLGSQRLELSYHGEGHEPGNIFIYAPEQKTLMAVDLVFPGWIPFRRFAVAHDVPGWLAQVELIATLPFEKLVGGHVARVGTRDDVLRQIAFDHDVKDAVAAALHTAPFIDAGSGIDAANPWALTADYTARVAAQCVRTLAPKWRNRLGGFDAFVWDQCYAMEQSLRVD